MDSSVIQELRDPIRLARALWPQVDFYREQQIIIRSVWEDDETYVGAGNKLGKDFVAGFITVAYFLTRHPCRILTTSAKEDHLRVLWGEINWFIQNSRIPLLAPEGPLTLNHLLLRKVVNGAVCPTSYVKGMVASDESMAAMGGHHADPKVPDGLPHTLLVVDEASSVKDEYIKVCRPWAKRILVIGNTWPCENFFKRAIKGAPGTEDHGGDIPRQSGRGYHRRVLRIRAVDSPNIRLALLERQAGREPSGTIVVPGVKDYDDYLKNLATWDKHQQTVSLEAEFYEGAEILLFPREWLTRAANAELAALCRSRPAEAIGIDPAEGGDSTAMASVNRYGIRKLRSRKTPNTDDAFHEAVAFMKEEKVRPENVVWDRGGGGKQHADRMRAAGYKVRTVAFGEGINLDPKSGMTQVETRLDSKEDRQAYRNRRSEMYGELSLLLDPGCGPAGFHPEWPTAFAIPSEYAELHRQLSPIPKVYVEGRLELPPKNRRPGQDTKQVTLFDLLGCSPDEADSVALGVHGLLHKAARPKAGAF